MTWNYFIRQICCISVICLLYTSCSKSGKNNIISNTDSTLNILSYDVNGMNAQVSISYPNIFVQFDSSVTNPGSLVASFSLSPGAQANINGTPQISGTTENNFDYPMLYTLSNANAIQTTWEVIGTNNSYTVNWGLGQYLKKSLSNNRNYNWYIDQSTTGTCSSTNCGPSCAAMAMKWVDSNSAISAADVRSVIYDSCNDWVFPDIITVFNQHNISYQQIPLGDSASQMWSIFTNQLDSGHIIIIGVGMEAIRESTAGPDSRVDQFLSDGFGHFLILKGYKQTDQDNFFEVYDPWDLGQVYPDGTPKGENRYYRNKDIFIACGNFGGGPELAILPH